MIPFLASALFVARFSASQCTVALSSPLRLFTKEVDVLKGFQRDDSNEIQRLYRFLEEQNCEGYENLAIGWTPCGLRGLFATEAFEAGEYLFAVPFPATLLVQERIINPEDEEMETGKEVEDLEMEQAVSFLENFVSVPSWKPYVDCLPKVDQASFDATPDFWSAKALTRFPVPRLREQSLDRMRRIRAESQKGKHCTNDLQWAMWILRSRGFTSLKPTGGTLRERTVLMPLIDMINHNGDDPSVSIEVIESDVYDESFVALQALRPIASSEQITLRYGTGFETSLELLDRYGFYTEANPNDDRIDWDLIETDLLERIDDDQLDPTLFQSTQFCHHLRQLR